MHLHNSFVFEKSFTVIAYAHFLCVYNSNTLHQKKYSVGFWLTLSVVVLLIDNSILP